MKKLYWIGALSIITAAIFWALDGVFLRPHLYAMPAALVVFWEHALGFIALSPFFLAARKELKLISGKQWGAVFWIVLFGGAIGTYFITQALFLTQFKSISVVMLLQKLQPIFAIVLAIIFLREKFGGKFYAWAALAIIGGYLITFPNFVPDFHTGEQLMLAALYSLIAAFSFGSSTTFGKYAVRTINYKLLAALRFGLTAALIFLVVMYLRVLAFPPAAEQWLILLIVVFTSGAASMFLYYYGLKKVTASQSSLYELAFPVSAVILDYIINRNLLNWSQMLGAVILVYAVYKVTKLQPIYKNIIGVVEKGAGMGVKLGFKTANLDPALAAELTTGIYMVKTKISDKTYQALLHYGYNSLQDKITLELLIKDLNEDLYGREVEIEIEYKIREVKKFKNPDAAIETISRDYKVLQNS